MFTIDQIISFLHTPLALIIAIVLVVSGIWYFVKEAKRASVQPLTAKGTVKTFIWGKPLALLAIAAIIIAIIMAITYWQIAQIG